MLLVLFIYSFEIIDDYIKQKNYVLTSRSSSTGWEQTNISGNISGFLPGQGNIREFWISFIKNVSENVIKSGEKIFLLDQHYKKFK